VFGTLPGAPAYGERGKQTFVGEALIKCLDGAAAEPIDGECTRWQVSLWNLVPAMNQLLAEKSDMCSREQAVTFGGGRADGVVLHRLDAPPDVELELSVEPPAAHQLARLELSTRNGDPVTPPLPVPLDAHPYLRRLSGGIYCLDGRIEPKQSGYVEQYRTSYLLKPPRGRWKVEMGHEQC
jgi:hypothetical protein